MASGALVFMHPLEAPPRLPPLSKEFDAATFGDARLATRLGILADAAAEAPDKGFPIQAGSDAALEATYRFLNNPRVTPERILAPHYACTASRAAEAGLILCVQDSSEFDFDPETARDVGWLTPSKPGFLGHFALAVSAEGLRRPLGLLDLATIFRSAFPEIPDRDLSKKKREKKNKGRGTDLNGESRRWIDTALEASARLAGQAAVIHVMDREGDSFALLDALLGAGQRFVIRVNHDRVVTSDDGKDRLFAVLSQAGGVIERPVRISGRKKGHAPPKALKEHPERDERLARLLFSATTATLQRPKSRSSQLSPTLTLNFVRVWEPEPPDGEEPVEWRLVTTEPVGTPGEIVAVADKYRARWVIEEFVKALKTGCAFQKRQIENRAALLNALAVLAPVAWRLLLLRTLSRDTSDAPATEALTETQVKILVGLVKRGKLKAHLSRQPTVREAMLAIAALGGHIKHNGPPGWIVLERGFDKLLNAEVGWWLAVEELG